MECDWVEFVVGGEYGEDCSKSIVGGIGFNDNLCIRYPMCKNRSRGEGLLTIVREVPDNTLPSKSGEWDDDVGVLFNKPLIEVTKTQEELNVLYIPRFWPFQDCLDFVRGHPEPLGGEDVAKVLNSIGMKLTLVHTSE